MTDTVLNYCTDDVREEFTAPAATPSVLLSPIGLMDFAVAGSTLWDDTRADWGAAARKYTPTYVAPADRTEFFNHYDGGVTVGLAGKPHSECLAMVKRIQAYHQNQKGWNDIGYNGLTCPHGRAIEGRGIDYAGAHCTDHNRSGYGVQMMYGGSERPTDVSYARQRRLYDALVSRGRALAKKGHRDCMATACPGDIIYGWVKSGMPFPASQPAPPPTTTPPTLRWMRASVIDFQRILETGADGKWGPATDVRALAVRAVANPAIAQTVTQIKIAQAIADVKVDGILGPITTRAMRNVTAAVQRVLDRGAGIVVDDDGVWGPITDRALLTFRTEWRGRY